MRHTLRDILIPSWGQAFSLTMLSVLILIGGYAGLILGRILQALSIPRQDFYSGFGVYFDYIGQLDASYYILMGLFWMGIGVLTYIGVWVIGSLLRELRNVVRYEWYYVNKASLKKMIVTFSSRILLAMAVIAAVIITSVYGIPLWLSLFSNVLFASLIWTTGLYAVASVIGLAVNLYILWEIYKIFKFMN